MASSILATSFRCENTQSNRTENKTKEYTSDEIDVFVVYSIDLDKFYWVPVEDAPSTTMYLRVTEAKQNQSKNINLASNYEI